MHYSCLIHNSVFIIAISQQMPDALRHEYPAQKINFRGVTIMRHSIISIVATMCASQALAQEPTATPMVPIAASFGELIDEGYNLITIDFRGTAWLEDGTNKLIAYDLSGDPSTEILSVCYQVGK